MMQKLKRMVPTELCSGSKNKKPKKTEPSKVTNGFHHLSMWEIGETTAKKDSVFSTTRTAINTKVCGQLTKGTARALTGRMKIRNFVVNILATGLKIKSTVVEHFSTKTAIGMTDIGLTDSLKERVE